MIFGVICHTRVATLFPGLLLVGVCLLSMGCSEAQDRPQEDPASSELDVHEAQDDQSHDEEVVELSDEKSAAAGIETSAASFQGLPALLSTTGQVDFNQDRVAHVSPRIPGRVHEVRASLGQRVKQGEVLVSLDSIELGRAKADYLRAKARVQLTRENFDREERLFADRISSQQEMLSAKAAFIETEAEMRSAEETLHLYGLTDDEVASVTYENPGRSLVGIRAPLSGKIVEKHVTVGELVTPERNLFSLADLSEVWVWIDVYERDLPQVHLDDGVDVRVDAFREEVFSGTVSYLSDRVDLDTRRVRARIDVANPGERLRPGMFAQVELSDPHAAGSEAASRPALVVPASAIQRDGDVTILFISLGGRRYQRHTVEIGRRTGDLVEVTSGLEAGEEVVSAGAFFLKSELAKEELGEGHGH